MHGRYSVLAHYLKVSLKNSRLLKIPKLHPQMRAAFRYMFLRVLATGASGKEGQDLCVQNECHADGGDDLVADIEEGPAPELVSGELAFFDDHVDLPDPAYHEGHHHCAKRHHDTFGEHVIEVEPAVTPHWQVRCTCRHIIDDGLNAKELCGCCKSCTRSTSADTVKSNGQAEDEDDNSSDDSVLLASGSLTSSNILVNLEGGDNLEQGHGGGNSCDEDETVEQEADDVADVSHVVEYLLHGSEEQTRASAGLAAEECVACGHNDHAGHDSNEGIANDDDNCVLLDALLLLEVGAVGYHSAHAEGQGEEHLTCGGLQNAEEVSLQRLNVPAEHELVAAHSAGLNCDVDDNDEEHYEQCGHTDLAELLDTAGNACSNDESVKSDEDRSPENHLAAVAGKCAEEFGDGNTPGIPAEDCGQVAERVAHDHAAEDEVEAEDEERHYNCHIAHPGELLAELPVSCDRAHAGLTTDCKFADHNGEANEDCKDKINQQEGKAAVETHLVREAPNVAQTDCRTDSSQNETQVGAKRSAIVFHNFLSLLISTVNRTRQNPTTC